MGKYTDKPAIALQALHYHSPHAALMHHFEDYFDLWEQFEDLWRQSYPPPACNLDKIQPILAAMAQIRSECKGLYNQLRLDPSAIHPIQKFPPIDHIKNKKKAANAAKYNQKKGAKAQKKRKK